MLKSLWKKQSLQKSLFLFGVVILFSFLFLINIVGADGEWSDCVICEQECESCLISHWEFEDDLLDSKDGNNGEFFIGSENYVSGAFGKSLKFLSGDYVKVLHNSNLNPTEELSVEVWVNPDSNDNPQISALVKKSDVDQTNGYTIEGANHIYGGKNKFRFIIYLGADDCPGDGDLGLPVGWCSTGPTPSLDSEWHQLVGTYDGSKMKLYLNGVLVSGSTFEVSGEIGESLNDLMIGKDPSNPDVPVRFSKGKIDEVAIYSCALTSQEVLEHYYIGVEDKFICEEECYEPECCDDEDCGIDHCLGGPNYCLDGNVYQDFIVYTCNNPGQVDAYCSSEIVPWLIEECDCNCENGECLSCPEPFCGDNILNLGIEECDDGNNINGDGCSSVCEIEYCGDEIINNNEECEFDEDCEQGYSCNGCLCVEEPEPPDCCDDEDCDDDYYSDKYCVGDDVYRDFHDFFCENEECDENILKELVEECDEDCKNGKCVDDDDNGSCCHHEDCNYCNLDLSNTEKPLVVYESLDKKDVISNKDVFLIEPSKEKITNNSWVVYLFIGCVGLIVLILIALAVKG